MFLDILKAFALVLVQLVKTFAILLIVPVFIVFVLGILVLYRYLHFRYIEHIKPKKSDVPIQKKTSLFQNLFVLWPKQMAYDVLTRDPNKFMEDGIHIAVGKQGSGKTITMIYLLEQWRKMYPKLIINSNLKYEHADSTLTHWKQMIESENDIYGVVNVIDEIQTWFSSKESGTVTAPMLGEICQQRKQIKAMFGTVQVFGKLAKEFREQTKVIYVPHTFFKSLTFVRMTKPEWYDERMNTFRKYQGFFLFAHTNELRSLYDTYEKIERYKEMEFSDTPSSLFANEGEAPRVVEVSLSQQDKKRK